MANLYGPVLIVEDVPAPLIRALVAERSRGRRTPELAAEFHRAVADLALAWARHGGRHCGVDLTHEVQPYRAA